MGLETFGFIDSLNASNPVAGTDQVLEGDDHIRGIKSTLKSQFPNLTAAVNPTATELNTLDGITATTAELNKLDGVTATTAELNTMAGVTSTTAELNILDGVTSTTAEINELDESASAVANYSSGVRYYHHDEVNDSTSLDIDANIGATFESVGPTGSGATNIWTALDSVPAGATGILMTLDIAVQGTGDGAYQLHSMAISARSGASTDPLSASKVIASLDVVTETNTFVNRQNIVNQTIIPIDSSRVFDLATTRGSDGTTVFTVAGRLAGFIK